jgi:hypothetical protein
MVMQVSKAEQKITYMWAKTADNCSLTHEFLAMITRVFSDLSIFVESGTLYGQTTKTAAQLFRQVHSVELNSELVKMAQKKFAETSNVFLYHGSSDEVFYEILPKLKSAGKILFWLDAHGFVDNENQKTCNPIIQEFQAIKASGITDAVILIDDLRDFGVSKDYPDVSFLKEALQSINPNYEFYIFGDLGLAFLKDEEKTVSRLIQAMTDAVLYRTFVEDSFKDVLAHADEQERMGVKKLAVQFGRFYTRWAALL